jgi:hypothetical protein
MKCVPSGDIDKYTIFYMNFHYTEFTYAWKLVTREPTLQERIRAERNASNSSESGEVWLAG